MRTFHLHNPATQRIRETSEHGLVVEGLFCKRKLFQFLF
nr:unnamed protein product [Callosobruchus analis]